MDSDMGASQLIAAGCQSRVRRLDAIVVALPELK
jgi:hypothetical protein